HAVPFGHAQPFRHQIDAEYAARAALQRDAAAHLPDRSESEYRYASALRNLGELDRLPSGRQHVGEKQKTFVVRTFRYLDRAELCLRHAQVFGLSARHLTMQLGVAEQRRAIAVFAHLRGFALRVELPIAHPATSAGDPERHDNAIAGLDLRHLAADFLDNAHRFVTDDVALFQKRSQYAVKMQIRTADRGGGDAHDRVGGMLDFRIRNIVDAKIFLAVERDCFHR